MKNEDLMARPLGKRGQQKVTYLVGSNTNDGDLKVESELEALTALALDIDPRVLSIRAQPCTFRLDLRMRFDTSKEARVASPEKSFIPGDAENSSEEIYTPDFEVEWTNPVMLLVETKPAKALLKISEKMDRRRAVLGRLGYRLVTATDEDIGHKGLRANMAYMRDAQRFHTRKPVASRIEMDALQQVTTAYSGEFKLGDIRERVSDNGIRVGLANGVIAFDLRQGTLNNESVLWNAFGELSRLQLLNLGA